MSNLAQRLLSAAVAIPVIVVFVFFLPTWTIVFPVALFMFLGSLETIAMIGQGKAGAQGIAGAAVATGLACSLLFIPGGRPELLRLALGGAGAALVLLGLVFWQPIETAARRSAALFTAAFYPCVLLALIALMHRGRPDGRWMTLCILMTAFLGDTCAYFAGRFFGARKLAPRLSPKKTVEGAFGAVAGGLLATVSAHFIFLPSITLVDAVVLGAGGAACGMLGDLFESLLKRSSGIKDSGRLLPGHGGVMDRIDGLLLVAPFFYFYLLLKP